MPRFVLRYRGDVPNDAARGLAPTDAVHLVNARGRTLLVEATAEDDVRLALEQPEKWVISPESATPRPPTPHPVVKQVKRPKKKPPPR